MIIIIKNIADISELTALVPNNRVIDSSNFVLIPDNCTGIILSGSEKHVYDFTHAFSANIQSIVQGAIIRGCPILGICYGMQLISAVFGGKVVKIKTKMQGKKQVGLNAKSPLFEGSKSELAVFNNQDIVEIPPKGFKVSGWSGAKTIVAIENRKHNIYGVQFHPERHKDTHFIINNFVKMCEPGPPVPVPVTTDFKQLIIKNLKDFATKEKIDKQYFKVKAYNTVIKALEAHPDPIYTADDLKKIPGIGKSIADKISEVFKNPTKVHEDHKQYEQIEMLTKVHGIGIVKAKELYFEHNIRTIEDLKNKQSLLNNVQLKGLKYFDDIEKRIPKKEMEKHQAFLKTVFHPSTQITWEIAGSFRRNKPDSGDIDVIVSSTQHTPTQIIEILSKTGYIAETLASGDKKFLGVCRLPRHKTHRRIDLIFTPANQYPFALLYFTGSQQFNISMRNIALQKGYSLNEYGLTPPPPPPQTFKTEKDIFDFLEMKWVDPASR